MPKRIAWLFGLVLATLALSLAANVYLVTQTQEYYSDLNEVRLDPLGLGLLPPASPPAGSQPIAVFFGDSRAAEWPAPATVSGYTFVNRGLGAQTTAQVLGRFSQHVVPLRPRLVIVQAGINDLKTIPIFPAQQAAIIAACKTNLEQIVSQATADDATVILTTIFPVGVVPITRQWVWSEAVTGAVDEVNAHLRGLAGDDVIVFDTYALLADAGQAKAEYSRDTLHFNPAAYEMLNVELAKILTEID